MTNRKLVYVTEQAMAHMQRQRSTHESAENNKRNEIPRILTDAEKKRLEEFTDGISYSSKYCDAQYEYRHVQLPKPMLKVIPPEYFDPVKKTLKLLWEDEWRGLGITQSLGWEHYEVHVPEPHILLFKRPLDYALETA